VKWSWSGYQVSDDGSNPRPLLDKHSLQDLSSVEQQKMAMSMKMLEALHPAEIHTCKKKCFT